MGNKTSLVEKVVDDVVKTDSAQNNRQNQDIQYVINKTMELDTKIGNLEQLKTIQNLQDLNSLENTIKQLNDRTHLLSLNEQARKEDFLALFNQTLEQKAAFTNFKALAVNRLQQQEIDMNQTLTLMNSRFQHYVEEQNRTLNTITDDLGQSLLQKMDELENKTNQQISDANVKVALSSCVQDERVYSAGSILRFPDIRTRVGVDKISLFIGSGKFECENPGLYLVSVSIISHKSGAYFSLYQNGNVLTTVYISDHSGLLAKTGTTVLSLKLNLKDNIWVEPQIGMLVYARHWSCITILKIK